MAAFLFVHGTGVRKESFDKTLEEIETQLAQHDPRSTVTGCYWGDIGAKLPPKPHSIPTYESTKALGAAITTEDQALVLWEMLYGDPLFELRLMAQAATPAADPSTSSAAAAQSFSFTQGSPAQALEDAVVALRDATAVERAAQAIGLDRWDDAWTLVHDSDPYQEAMASPLAGTGAHRLAIARALVAALISRALDDALPTPTAADRDALIDEVLNEIGGRDKAVTDIITKPLLGLAERFGTWKVKRNRGEYTDKSFEALGDILLYQARGDDIRACIRRDAEQVGSSVVLLAHSLGGIACVDLLADDRKGPPPRVRGLVTAGSQSPFFYEIGALWSRAYGATMPGGFPKWLNFYDRNDPLSYMGREVFPDYAVEDLPVASGQPFPASHSAYWRNPVVWRAIKTFVDGLPA